MTSADETKRAPGYYWVRFKDDKNRRLHVAEWQDETQFPPVGRWFLTGDSEGWTDEHIEVFCALAELKETE